MKKAHQHQKEFVVFHNPAIITNDSKFKCTGWSMKYCWILNLLWLLQWWMLTPAASWVLKQSNTETAMLDDRKQQQQHTVICYPIHQWYQGQSVLLYFMFIAVVVQSHIPVLRWGHQHVLNEMDICLIINMYYYYSLAATVVNHDVVIYYIIKLSSFILFILLGGATRKLPFDTKVLFTFWAIKAFFFFQFELPFSFHVNKTFI